MCGNYRIARETHINSLLVGETHISSDMSGGKHASLYSDMCAGKCDSQVNTCHCDTRSREVCLRSFSCKLTWICLFKMGLKTAFTLLFLLGVTEYAKAAAVDENAIGNLAMEDYQEILNISGT